ncbi:PAS domain-containing protein [bacterium]|nr:PAS domain-containing protein [bacterium]
MEKSSGSKGQSAVEKSKKNFPIVGIGASAGGLAAFEAFFSAMPTDVDPDMAFVLVQHLAPDHKSILTELVTRYTRMQVSEVVDGVEVKPNCAYIIPPNRDMAFLDGKLHLLDQTAPRGMRMPIDFFFRSLAQDQRERAICIVLSGTGSDGTLGVRAIKGEGGMAMAQFPESTEFDGMPRSAIETGLVDYVLPPAEMSTQLMSYVAHALGSLRRAAKPVLKEEDALKKVFILVRAQTGHDFSQYKPSTINRRIERRMAVQQIKLLKEYVSFLQHNPVEVEALFNDLLIGVTSFFRDTDAFTVLEKKVIPQLFASKPLGSYIRVWTPGCSTGEEAYSIAMLLQEHIDELKKTYLLQVFATDIDGKAIDQARTGKFPASIASDISTERLQRFFVKDPSGGGYRIQKKLRDILIFSEQDVIKDPPFSRIDLISCRNLLIYMDGELQKRLIPLFHYALNPGGKLFLGSSETVGEYTDLFSPLDRSAKIYECKEDIHRIHHPVIGKFPPHLTKIDADHTPSTKMQISIPVRLRETVEKALLQHYPASALLVTEAGDILYLHGRTGTYLEPAPGEAGMNVLKMAREGLRRKVATNLRKVIKSGEIVREAGLKVKTNGEYTTVNLIIRPIKADDELHSSSMCLIIIEHAQSTDQHLHNTNSTAFDSDDERFKILKQELQAKDEYLQTTVEELETSNEELKSSNEELQSVNEELQSTNEELETSKEELQSVNEELATVNAELQDKVNVLSRINNDMNNLLAGTEIGTIFVDHQLRVLRFTPTVTQIISLIQTDIGRPITNITLNIKGYNSFSENLQEVLNTLIPIEVEILTNDDLWFLMRIRPYRTIENVIEGAVVTFTEITETKLAQEVMSTFESVNRLATVVRDAYDAIIVINLDGKIMEWNPAAERIYGWSEAEALTMNIHDLIPVAERKKALEKIMQLGKSIDQQPYRAKRIRKDEQIVDIWLTKTGLINDSGAIYAIATTERIFQRSDTDYEK